MTIISHQGEAALESPAKADTSKRGTGLQVQMFSSLQKLPAEYLSLFEQAGQTSVFLTLPWFENFVETGCERRDSLHFYGIGGEAPAVPQALLAMSHVEPSGLLSLRQLCSLANYYSPLFGPLVGCSGSKARDAMRRIIASIRAERRSWDAILLKPLDADSELFAILKEELKNAGYIVQTFFSAGNWYEPIGGRSYREYFENLRSSVRNIAKSKNKKIDRSGRVSYEIISDAAGIDKAIAAYNQVYAASWKVPEPYPGFVPGLIRTCAREKTLRLGLAYVDGEPAAAQVWIVHHNVASIYKIAYDQKYRDLSVGTYLTCKMMEHVIDVDHVQEVDYLTGDDNYKKDWMSKRRERWGILALNPRTARGAMGIVRHIGGRAAKRAAMSVVGRFKHLRATEAK